MQLSMHSILWLLSHTTIVETMDSYEKRMNPITITIINLRTEYRPSWGSNKRTPVRKSPPLPTQELGLST